MFKSLKNYIQDQITLAKLESVESIGRIISKIAIMMVILLFSLFFLLTISFAIGYYLSSIFEKRYLGFLIVAGIYFGLIMITLLFKKNIQNIIINIVISATMNNPKSELKRIKEKNR